MIWMRRIGLMAGLFSGLIASVGAADGQPGPREIVQEISGEVLEALQADHERFKADPKALASVVRRHLVPAFDTTYSARLILGRHGRGATKQQISDFAKGVVELLVERYAVGLIDFNSEEQIEIMPAKGKGSDKLTRVHTRVKLGGGKFAPVDYAFHKTEEGWRVFDVSVEGISYVTTYRSQFAKEIQSKGLQAVIDRLLAGEGTDND